ncbi:MAG: glutamate ligase domain-containing protein, partial [Paracoccaceae bacterium]
FASVDGIAHEKAAIMEGLMPGGVAVLPADLPTTPILVAKAAATGAKPVLFGTADTADWQMDQVQVTDTCTIVRASHHGQPLLYKVLSPGRHFAANALATLAVADALGLDPAIAAADIGNWQPPAGRGTRERIVLDMVEETAFDLIDDAFNANPTSMAASLDVLIATQPEHGTGRIGAGRRIAILGDMLELGSTELTLHQAIARYPGLEAIDRIHCVGPRMRALWLVLPRSQRGEHTDTAVELSQHARGLIDAGDIVLVKGSKGSKVSLVVDALRKLGQGVPSKAQGEA